MKEAFFRFYAELNFFLSPGERGRTIGHRYRGRPAVKDRIETLGVPHPEVEMILVDGEAVDFSYQVVDGDRIGVYPHFTLLPVPEEMLVREPYRGRPRFVLDVHLGQLARYLRMLGFDTLYSNRSSDARLAHISAAEGRILLTRDRGLLKRREVVYGYLLREDGPRRQLLSVIERCGLRASIEPFGRCLECNGTLERVNKEEIRERLEPRTKRYYKRFRVCEGCGRIYWPGSHYQRMKRFIGGLDEHSG